MAYTNFVGSGVAVNGAPLVPGGGTIPLGTNYWYVRSVNGSNGNEGTYDSPFATLAFAVSKAAAGDVIVLEAGHAETVTAAGGITINVANISIVGLGNGNGRPTFTFSTAVTASILISANQVSFTNFVGISGIDQLTQPIDVRGAGCTITMEWQDSASNVEAVRAVLGSTAADRLTLNLRYIGQTGGSHCVNAVRLNGTDNAIITLDAYGKFSTAVVEFVTTACTNVEIYGYMYNSGTTNFSKDVVDTITGSTWFSNFYDGAAGGTVSGGSAAALASDDVSAVTDQAEKSVASATAVMVNGNTIFTVAGGPIMIVGLASVCITGNDTTASTLQYSVTPTSGSAQTISGASASLASALAGASVTLAGTALATAALLNANGPNLIANPGTIFCPAGTIKIVIGVGSTTGTWKHYLRYKPMVSGVTVS